MSSVAHYLTAALVGTFTLLAIKVAEPTVVVRGEVIDAETKRPLPARLYIRSSDGRWFFPKSTLSEGSAVTYRKQRFEASIEMHTTLSAHPFRVELPPGRYTLSVEHGKEYFPVKKTLVVEEDPLELKIPIKRWIDMAAVGWYSGDTHVHRSMAELPNLVLAEDLNVALPLSYWVRTAGTPPGEGGGTSGPELRAKPIYVDETHVIYPLNTEYEIFRVDNKRHTLGAVFILGHKTVFEEGVPPVRPIAERARQEGALLDLDKHSWPWSLMLVPVMEVDLFELANNHVWRTEFGFRQWSRETVPAYMRLEEDEEGFTEWGWIDFGLQTYYALLNCGFRMRPTAGTASGVHPVPLGFGRVYVELPQGFDYRKWMEGLAAGRSFVTTGPMLMVTVDGRPPGARMVHTTGRRRSSRVTGLAASARPLRSIEIIVNGHVAQRISPVNRETERGGYESTIDTIVELKGSSWMAVRIFEDRPDNRTRFAHSGPVHIEFPGEPLRPRRQEVDYLIRRMKEELARNKNVLLPEALKEYAEALQAYEELAKKAH